MEFSNEYDNRGDQIEAYKELREFQAFSKCKEKNQRNQTKSKSIYVVTHTNLLTFLLPLLPVITSELKSI